MRATERLLEVIIEQAIAVAMAATNERGIIDENVRKGVNEINACADELRRRGDTLVRMDDLRRIMAIVDAVSPTLSVSEDHRDAHFQSINRLEIALGGKLR